MDVIISDADVIESTIYGVRGNLFMIQSDLQFHGVAAIIAQRICSDTVHPA